MSKTYLSFGSNLGNRLRYLKEAKQLVEKNIGDVSKASSIYETEPWGFVHENMFLNQVMTIQIMLDPLALLKEINKIESSLGRLREKTRYNARTIDIDILFYDNLVIITSELNIPHPEIPKRRFVLEPLAEIAPDLEHPVLKKTMKQLLYECRDISKVYKY